MTSHWFYEANIPILHTQYVPQIRYYGYKVTYHFSWAFFKKFHKIGVISAQVILIWSHPYKNEPNHCPSTFEPKYNVEKH